MWPVVVSILAMLPPFTRVLPPVHQLRVRRRGAHTTTGSVSSLMPKRP
jgi:hypothetical protein